MMSITQPYTEREALNDAQSTRNLVGEYPGCTFTQCSHSQGTAHTGRSFFFLLDSLPTNFNQNRSPVTSRQLYDECSRKSKNQSRHNKI
mmetsp:Transcript_60967/g.69756  ORF Transcript_60967/g.69756 Transcript_60967/m.69756 type:complete len:89 (-) Transcript_60967:418-684(-)